MSADQWVRALIGWLITCFVFAVLFDWDGLQKRDYLYVAGIAVSWLFAIVNYAERRAMETRIESRTVTRQIFDSNVADPVYKQIEEILGLTSTLRAGLDLSRTANQRVSTARKAQTKSIEPALDKLRATVRTCQGPHSDLVEPWQDEIYRCHDQVLEAFVVLLNEQSPDAACEAASNSIQDALETLVTFLKSDIAARRTKMK